MLAGFSGNLSLCPDNSHMLITCSGAAKGRLIKDDLAVLSLKNGNVLKSGSARPSSESALHLEIYKAFPQCKAILHTHPTYMQALELKLNGRMGEFLNIQLFEAEVWRQRLAFIQPLQPGDMAVAKEACQALRGSFNSELPLPCGVWLGQHGLCAIGPDLPACMSFNEELEHLAKVQLLSL